MICLFLLSIHQIYAKVLIIIPVYNRPDFIEWQCNLFKKFLKDDYEIKMFNDADNDPMQQAIEQTCANLGITCIRVPQNLHNIDPNCYRASASFRHGEVLQFAFDNYGYDHDDIVAVFDSDVFLIHEWNIRDYMRDYDLNAAVVWGDPNAMITGSCVHFLIMNMPKLEHRRSFGFRAKFENGGFEEPGGDGLGYFKAHPDLNIKCSSSLAGVRSSEALNLNAAEDVGVQLESRGYTPAEIDLILSIRNSNVYCDIGFWDTNLFLDYKHGSGWNGPTGQMVETKNRLVGKFIHSLLGQ